MTLVLPKAPYKPRGSYFDDFEFEKVKGRLPLRPRLRIYGAGLSFDLIPAITEFGDVIPDTWVLPQTRDPSSGLWQTRYGYTSDLSKHVEQLGLKARILKD